jgi:DNA phosphorothioation-associated putative methyltransferase
VGCAAVLYGDYRNADLVKIHIGSGKVSLMRYDDFEGQALPRMVERVKIKLREQDIDYFAYGDAYEPPFLFRKSRFINEEFANYPEQVAFDEALEGLGLFDFSGSMGRRRVSCWRPWPGTGWLLMDSSWCAPAPFPTWTTPAARI